jgi:UDP-N-acetyl-D-galactosamine dehydrogenase
VADVVKELMSYGVSVEVTDPKANSEHLKHEYGFDLISQIGKDYDAIIIAVNHNEFADYDEAFFKSITCKGAVIVDLKGTYKGKLKEISYWSL